MLMDCGTSNQQLTLIPELIFKLEHNGIYFILSKFVDALVIIIFVVDVVLHIKMHSAV